MSTSPKPTGRTIGMTRYATRAVLERRSSATFQHAVAVNALAGNGEQHAREQLTTRVTTGLEVDDTSAMAILTELAEARLVEPGPDDPSRLRLTGTGEELSHRLKEATVAITSGLYGGIPAEDMENAARVLTTVLARANAELDAAA